jgi:hypothetical protein
MGQIGGCGSVSRRLGLRVVCAALVALLSSVPAGFAQEMCKGKRPLDPRNARLKVLDIRVTDDVVVGRIKNDSGETASGAMIWVSYFMSRGGGLLGQQCIPIGDLSGGEERPFRANPVVEVLKAEAWDYAAEALSWK